MNLVSCENCGNVINKDRIKISDEIYDLLDEFFEEGFQKGKAENYWAWNKNENEWGFYIKCPACKIKIFRRTGDKVR